MIIPACDLPSATTHPLLVYHQQKHRPMMTLAVTIAIAMILVGRFNYSATLEIPDERNSRDPRGVLVGARLKCFRRDPTRTPLRSDPRFAPLPHCQPLPIASHPLQPEFETILWRRGRSCSCCSRIVVNLPAKGGVDQC